MSLARYVLSPYFDKKCKTLDHCDVKVSSEEQFFDYIQSDDPFLSIDLFKHKKEDLGMFLLFVACATGEKF